MARYKIADVIFSASPKSEYVKDLCKNYLYFGDESEEIHFDITKEDMEREMEYAKGLNFPKSVGESLALYRKFLEYAINRNTIILHCSALAAFNEAYLFTAPSGTGKSTHAKLWREVFNDGVVMINDDKPVIRLVDGEFYVYGTPWNGKHRIDSNVRAKIKGICHLKRGKENSIKEISPREMVMVLINQTLRPETEKQAEKFLEMLDKLLLSVKSYELCCNMEREAAIVAYEGMSGRKYEN